MQGFRPNSTFAVFSFPPPTFFMTMGSYVQTYLFLRIRLSPGYSPTITTMPGLSDYGLLTVRNSFPFRSKSGYPWHLTKTYSSRLPSCTLLGKHPRNHSSRPRLSYSMLPYTLASTLWKMPYSRNSLFPCRDSPHLLTRKRLKSSAKGEQGL